MVELGRAPADGPRVLLLDEPTSGLGEAELAKLGQQVTWLRESGTCAILLIEHDISFVMEHSDRIVALDAGRVLAVGSPDEIQAEAIRPCGTRTWANCPDPMANPRAWGGGGPWTEFLSLLVTGIVSGGIYASAWAAGSRPRRTPRPASSTSRTEPSGLHGSLRLLRAPRRSWMGEPLGGDRDHLGDGASPRPAPGPLRVPPPHQGQRRIQDHGGLLVLWKKCGAGVSPSSLWSF